MNPTFTTVALSLGLAVSFAASAQAQTYPERPITIVVPFSAGGPTDTVTRLIAEAMSQELGQQILVQNVAGAGGTLGGGQVAVAANDGYTLLLHHIGMSTTPTLYPNLSYDPLTDFTPIGLVTAVPMTLVARGDLAPTTLDELVAFVQENGETVTYAHAGIGSASHLCGLLFMESLDVAMTEVPYGGTGPVMTDLIGGQIDMTCDQTTNTTTQIQGGEIKAYAVTTPERLDALPDLQTTIEGGLPEMQLTVWHGLYGPAGMDPAIVERLGMALNVALMDENVITRFAELGTEPVTPEEATPEGLTDLLTSQIELWRPVIEAAGVTGV